MTSAADTDLDVSDFVPETRNRITLFGSIVRRNKIVAAVVTLLVLLVAFGPAFEEGAGLMDEGMLLAYPELIQHGKLPYRDFETFYGPANPALLAATFLIFENNIFVERTVGLIYRVVILLALFAIAEQAGVALAAGCLFLGGCLLLGTGLPAYAWFGALSCALWSLWFGSRSNSWASCFCGGFLAGVTLLFRIDVGPAIVLSALPLVLMMPWPQKRLYFLGGAIALLPLGILILIAGWHQVLNNLFFMPVIACNPARRLPVFSAELYVVNLFFAHLGAVAINVIAGWVAIRSFPREAGGRLLLAVALFGLGLTPQAIQRLDSLHLLSVAFISLGILPLSLVVLWSHFRGRLAQKAEILLAIMLVIATLQVAAPELTMMLRSDFSAGLHANAGATFVEQHGRSFPFHSPKMAATVDQMLKKLDELSAPRERLFVGPADLRRTNYNDTYIYHMMPKLTPATYFLEMNPFSANRPGSRLVADIESADWLVLNRAWDYWSEPNRSMDYGSSVPNAVVQKEFELCGEFGSYLLFHRKG
jgi:hypothetical protein